MKSMPLGRYLCYLVRIVRDWRWVRVGGEDREVPHGHVRDHVLDRSWRVSLTSHVLQDGHSVHTRQAFQQRASIGCPWVFVRSHLDIVRPQTEVLAMERAANDYHER